MLERLQFAQSPTEHLFVGTDRYMYFTVSWDADTQQLQTQKTYVDQADKTSRDSQTQDRCNVDPTRQYMALQLFDGIITVIPLVSKGKKKKSSEPITLGDPIPTRINEFFVRSSAFLHPRKGADVSPKLAILCEDNQQIPRLSIKRLDYSAGGAGDPGSASLDDISSIQLPELELGASHVLPVPAPTYGVLILAETSIRYYDDATGESLTEPLKQAAIFVAWVQVDGQRWLLADEYGRLFFLMLLIEDDEVKGWKLDMLGTTSRASTLVYLGNGLVFIGSHQGDAQVVQIQERSLQIMQSLPNVAPILDFTIMDMGNRNGEKHSNEYASGQARIVTGSGAFQDGSLRSIRSGVGMEEQGLLGEMEHITDLFSLHSNENPRADILIATFADETRVFHFSADGDVEETEYFVGLSLDEGSLLVTSIPGNRLLQTTHSKTRILHGQSGMVTAEWSTQDAAIITVASANDKYLALCIKGSEIVTLDLDNNLQVIGRLEFPEDGQISCIQAPSVCPDICIVGFWETSSVAVMNIRTLDTLQRVIMSEDAVAVPRSLILTQMLPNQPPTLLVAMANGEVVTFSMNTSTYALSARKATILGVQGATFKALPRENGLSNVFAICEHSSLIYGSEGRLIYAAVTAEEASCVCPFDCEAYPGAIAIATPKDLRIALVDTERTTHVQTLKVNETVRRVAYSPKLKAFGIGTIYRELRDNYEIIQSHFMLADEVLFKELDTYTLNEEELVESCIRADLRDGVSGDLVERFVVGTAYMDNEEQDTVRGRILVFAVGPERRLKLVSQLTVMGACRALGVIDGNIVAALVKTVVIYALDSPNLNKLVTYRTSTAPIALSISGSQIAVADLMKSLSVVTYARPTHPGGSYSLVETARHFQTAWSTAVACIDDHTWLESDAEGNLMVLNQDMAGVTDDDRRRLRVVGEIRLGEMVNKIQRVEVEESGNALVSPRAFMGTVDGSIYLFALIRQNKQDLLMRLQQAIASRVQSPGNVPFNTYRAFKNSVREEIEPYRVVDGELIEKYLDLPSSLQESICEEVGAQADVEEIRAMVEGLRRIH
ncbi:MAG: hypothetical protein Q9220_002805 [cf. Caloplaca sp. 1 TL-2023]